MIISTGRFHVTIPSGFNSLGNVLVCSSSRCYNLLAPCLHNFCCAQHSFFLIPNQNIKVHSSFWQAQVSTLLDCKHWQKRFSFIKCVLLGEEWDWWVAYQEVMRWRSGMLLLVHKQDCPCCSLDKQAINTCAPVNTNWDKSLGEVVCFGVKHSFGLCWQLSECTLWPRKLRPSSLPLHKKNVDVEQCTACSKIRWEVVRC